MAFPIFPGFGKYQIRINAKNGFRFKRDMKICFVLIHTSVREKTPTAYIYPDCAV